MEKEKRYVTLEYTLYVDADKAEARQDELMDLLDQHCSCVEHGGQCDWVGGSSRIMTEEQFDAQFEDEEEEDDRPKRRRRKSE